STVAVYFSNHPPPTQPYTLSLHDALPILFAERPVMLCDLPPLLGPQAFSGGPIILVNNALAWGGAERQLVTTLRSLDGRSGKPRSEEHTSELQSRGHLVCRLLLEKKKNNA